MLDPNIVLLGVAWYVVFLFSTTLHEASHALVAFRLGDPTAYHGGQVSLDPRPHLRREPFGMVLIPILSFVFMGGQWMFGWASAPYDPMWADRYPRRAAWMALGGPLANLLLAVVAGLLIRGGVAFGYLRPPDSVTFTRVVASTEAGGSAGFATVVSILFTLNLLLFIFNLLPLPPLDGSGVAALFLSNQAARRWQELMAQPMIGLLGILIAWQLIRLVFWPLFMFTLGLLYPGIAYG